MVHVKKPWPIAVQGTFHIAGSVATNSSAKSLKPLARAIRSAAHGLGLGSFRRDSRHAWRLLPVARSRRPRLTCVNPGCRNAAECHAVSSALPLLFCLWMFGSISFRRAQLPTWAFLPARHVALARVMYISSHAHRMCPSLASINPAGPVREKKRRVMIIECHIQKCSDLGWPERSVLFRTCKHHTEALPTIKHCP